ncbi:MAG: ABC transporter substrate-binding protein, partial [Candidatus Binatia bacterium]
MLRWTIAVIFVIIPALAQHAATQEIRLDPLIVSYSSVTGNRAPFWIAKDLGLYEKYGLDVKLVNIAAGNVSLTALLSGDVHLTTDSSSGVVA